MDFVSPLLLLSKLSEKNHNVLFKVRSEQWMKYLIIAYTQHGLLKLFQHGVFPLPQIKASPKHQDLMGLSQTDTHPQQLRNYIVNQKNIF